jgi:hypothetical protein
VRRSDRLLIETGSFASRAQVTADRDGKTSTYRAVVGRALWRAAAEDRIAVRDPAVGVRDRPERQKRRASIPEARRKRADLAVR